MKGLFEKILKLDRRWIFLAVFVATVVPFFAPMGLPVTVSRETRMVYDFIETMDPEGKPILLSFDYGPEVKAECEPMAKAVLRHLFSQNIKVVAISLHQAGPALALDALDSTAKEYGKEYGKDYVFMGFGAGFALMMAKMGESFPESFPKDYYGTPIAELPLARRVANYESVAMVLTLCGNRAYEYYISYAQARFGVRVAAGMTAVMASDAYPYFGAGQLSGLISGLKGAAEYEQLIHRPDRAFTGMDAQSITHVLIVLFIIAGNVAYYAARDKRPAQRLSVKRR